MFVFLTTQNNEKSRISCTFNKCKKYLFATKKKYNQESHYSEKNSRNINKLNARTHFRVRWKSSHGFDDNERANVNSHKLTYTLTNRANDGWNGFGRLDMRYLLLLFLVGELFYCYVTHMRCMPNVNYCKDFYVYLR